MIAIQLLNNLRDIRDAVEEILGSNCQVSLLLDRDMREQGLVLEIRHSLGHVPSDGLTYQLTLDDYDNLLLHEQLKAETIAWVKHQLREYVKRLAMIDNLG